MLPLATSADPCRSLRVTVLAVAEDFGPKRISQQQVSLVEYLVFIVGHQKNTGNLGRDNVLQLIGNLKTG